MPNLHPTLASFINSSICAIIQSSLFSFNKWCAPFYWNNTDFPRLSHCGTKHHTPPIHASLFHRQTRWAFLQYPPDSLGCHAKTFLNQPWGWRNPSSFISYLARFLTRHFSLYFKSVLWPLCEGMTTIILPDYCHFRSHLPRRLGFWVLPGNQTSRSLLP